MIKIGFLLFLFSWVAKSYESDITRSLREEIIKSVEKLPEFQKEDIKMKIRLAEFDERLKSEGISAIFLKEPGPKKTRIEIDVNDKQVKRVELDSSSIMFRSFKKQISDVKISARSGVVVISEMRGKKLVIEFFGLRNKSEGFLSKINPENWNTSDTFCGDGTFCLWADRDFFPNITVLNLAERLKKKDKDKKVDELDKYGCPIIQSRGALDNDEGSIFDNLFMFQVLDEMFQSILRFFINDVTDLLIHPVISIQQVKFENFRYMKNQKIKVNVYLNLLRPGIKAVEKTIDIPFCPESFRR